MFPSGMTGLEFDVQRCALRGLVDVLSVRDERAKLLPDSLLPQLPIVPRDVFESPLRSSAPEILKSDVCDGGLK
jgi:hypothetical protein